MNGEPRKLLAMLPDLSGFFVFEETKMSTDEKVMAEDQPENQPEETVEPSVSMMKGYESVTNPEKSRADRESEEVQTVETPPPEPVLTSEQAKDLLAQVSRIPELEKRLRDEGGRYGALKQTIEQMQQRIAESKTTREVEANSADAGELLADLREDFPELAEKLQGAFSRVMSEKGGSIDPKGIEQIISAKLEAEQESSLRKAQDILSEAHPDWIEVRETSDFMAWKETLPPRTRARFESSHDPYFVAEMLDQHKDWLSSKSKSNTPEVTKPAVNKRLADAVLPTNGVKSPAKGEPSAKESIRTGYERVAGRRF